MKQPTQEQLNDPAWWDENAPSGATHVAIHSHGKDWLILSPEGDFLEWHPFIHVWHNRVGGHSQKTIPRPTKPAEPDRTAPEWSDWKIPPGSWPHWMLERMHRETGRMSYDNPVKGMIRDLWRTVDRPQKAVEPDPTSDDSPSARIGELGNQVHNLSCELQNDEALADELGKVAATLWDLSKAATKQRERDAYLASVIENYRKSDSAPGSAAELNLLSEFANHLYDAGLLRKGGE